jgi:enoyl-CoA hydratase
MTNHAERSESNAMTYVTLRAEVEGRLGIITLDRPTALNALNSQMCLEIEAVMQSWSQHGGVHTVIITGAGEKAFVAGADLVEMRPYRTQEALEFLRKVKRAFTAMERFPYPVIAAVNGVAFGGGCEVALACDLRIAAEHARFGQQEINFGIVPGGGATQKLPRLIGLAQAREIIYTGRAFSATDAFRMGLVNRVVPANQLMIEARAWADEMLSKGPISLRTAKESTLLSMNTPLQGGLDAEVHLCAMLWDTVDQKEGMAAYFEKRRPEFKGQ